MPEINIEYELKDGLVTKVIFANNVGMSSQATVVEGTDEYQYSSYLTDDTKPVDAPKHMGLANVILVACVHLGLIPPIEFDPIEAPNQH